MRSKPAQVVPLGAIADVFTGATPSRSKPAYWNGAIPWVTTGDIDFNVITQAKEHITERAIKETSAKVFKSGTLLMAMYGQGATRGKVARLGLDAATNQACAAIVPRQGSVSTDYLFQVLAHSYDQVRGMSNSGGQANLSTGIIRQIPVPLVPPERQIEVVLAMACWDRAIHLVQCYAEKISARMEGIAAKLFGEASSSPNPALAAHFVQVTRKNTKRCPRALTISGQAGLVDQADYFDKAIAAEQNAHYTLLQWGEFAYNRSFSNGYPFGAIKRLEHFEEGAVSTLYLCFALRPDAPLDADYCAYFFESGVLNAQLRRVTQAGARAHGLLNISADDFMRLRIPVPSKERQQHVVRLLDTARREVKGAEALLEQLRLQKQCLAEHLLSGAAPSMNQG